MHSATDPLPPSVEEWKKFSDEQRESVCIFCVSTKGSLNEQERNVVLGEIGLKSLIDVSKKREDDVAARIDYMCSSETTSLIRFHKICRKEYTERKRVSLAIKRKAEESASALDSSTESNKRLSREETTFDWDTQCFICGHGRKKVSKGNLSLVNMKPEVILGNVRSAAERSKDLVVLTRLTFESGKSLFEKNARYHKDCYKQYIRKEPLLGKTEQKQNGNQPRQYEEIAKNVIQKFRCDLEKGEVVMLKTLAGSFRDMMVQQGSSPEEAQTVRTFYIRKKIESLGEKDFTFYEHQGLPTVFCKSSISVAALLLAMREFRESGSSTSTTFDLGTQEQDDDFKVLHKAAAIIRAEIEKIPPTTEYPNPTDILSQGSANFVPQSLKMFLLWLLDKESYVTASNCVPSDARAFHRAVTISECIIYSSRRFKKQVIPPFHLGVLLHLQHEYGSRKLIDTLNACGFCASYTELRSFLTALAQDELSKNEKVHVPSGLMKRDKGGGLIHEGDDNIDLNVETVDGKNTYHSLARVTFQMQSVGGSPLESSTRIPRTTESKTLIIDEQTQKQLALLPFSKPSGRVDPRRFHGISEEIKNVMSSSVYFFNPKDIVWVTLRAQRRGALQSSPTSTQAIPLWTGFNCKLTSPQSVVTSACYAPSINSKPSDMSTIYTCLVQGFELAKACGQKFHIHTFDQQLYAVAQQVKISRPTEFENLVLRLGGFHATACFISCIGKIWGAGGLRDMLVDSGVYAGNSADQMLAGKQFHRAVRGLTLCFEALTQLLLENFVIWCDGNDNNNTMTEFLSKTDEFDFSSKGGKNISDFNVTVKFYETKVSTEFQKFLEERCHESNTFKFWVDFLKAVSILLNMIRSEREGNWELHIQSQAAMLPYYFACDKPNYSRWGTLYVAEMLKALPEDVKSSFKNGEFAVCFTSGAFNGIWSDMAVEMSVIKDHKGDAGIIGFTRKEAAVLRWTLTRHLLGSYSKQMRIRCGLDDDPFQAELTPERPAHEQESKSFLKRDESHAQDMISFIKSSMCDPFTASNTSNLINISSGVVASPDVEESLKKFHSFGEKKLLEFLKNSLEEECKIKKSFYDRISKSSIKTFQEMKAKSTTLVNGIVLKKPVSAEIVFQRAFALSEARPEVNISKTLSYPLTSIPSALFKDDGTKRKSTKAEMLHSLEVDVKEHIIYVAQPDFKSLPLIYIIDAMADLNSIPWKGLKTYGDLGNMVLRRIEKKFLKCTEIHYVFDRYDSEVHPKNDERVLRHGGGGQIFEILSGRPLPEMSKFFANNMNKKNLAIFLSNYLETFAPEFLVRHSGKKLFIGGGYLSSELTKSISAKNISEDSLFFSNHTEADTRMIFHAIVASAENKISCKNLVIESPDTDVFLLLIGHFSKFPSGMKIWFFTGKTTLVQDHRRLIPIHEICARLGPKLSLALLPLHALTGCDTVSSFYNIGKKTVLKVAKKLSSEKLDLLIRLPSILKEPDVLKNAVTVTSMLYDPSFKYSKHHSSLTSMRIAIARDVRRNSSVDRMPPSEPAFYEHAKRAAWQANDWLNAHKSQIPLLDPTEYGWQMNDSELRTKYFDGPTSLDLLGDFFCSCRGKTPCSKRCKCQESGVGCCEVCACNAECKNNDTSDVEEYE